MTEVFSWSGIRLVVFDVDGTLYRQSPLRWRMARDLALDSARMRDFRPLWALRSYRRLREEVAEAEAENFNDVLIAGVASHASCSLNEARRIISEWMEQRPLRYLELCRYAGIPDLFDALRASGKMIGVLSDYTVPDKLASLGLTADHVVSAGDPEVGVLKPHPRGLKHMMSMAQVEAQETVLIGDRVERDGMAARRAGAHALIRSDRPRGGWTTFRRYDDPIFTPLLSRLRVPFGWE